MSSGLQPPGGVFSLLSLRTNFFSFIFLFSERNRLAAVPVFHLIVLNIGLKRFDAICLFALMLQDLDHLVAPEAVVSNSYIDRGLDLINIKRGRASPRFFAWVFLIFKH